jgi:hypothetical protein
MPRSINHHGIRSNNTTVWHEDGKTMCRLHQTIIATHDHAAHIVTLSTGGYCTPTTIRRMNECLHHWNTGHKVCMSDFKTDTLVVKV